MVKVVFKTYTQYGCEYLDNIELELDEEIEEDCETYDEARRFAKQRPYGCRGQFVEVYIDGKYYDEYEV